MLLVTSATVHLGGKFYALMQLGVSSMHLKIRCQLLAWCKKHVLRCCGWDWRVDLWFWFWGTFGFRRLWYLSSWWFIRKCWQHCYGRCRAKTLQCSALKPGLNRCAVPHMSSSS